MRPSLCTALHPANRSGLRPAEWDIESRAIGEAPVQTILDTHRELELECVSANGDGLTARVVDLVLEEHVSGRGGRVRAGMQRYRVRFGPVAAHAVVGEFHAVLGDLVAGEDAGFLRRVECPDLQRALGLLPGTAWDVVPYALVTAHEVLIAFCYDVPCVEAIADA